MTQQRRSKRFLSGEQKYDLWVRILTSQITRAQAAAEAGVDRSTISNLRKTARDGAIAALTAAKPGRCRSAEEVTEVAKLRAEVDRLGGVIIEQAVELAVLAGKSELGLNGPIPLRAPELVKRSLLDIVADAVADGWSQGRVCAVLGLDWRRLWRWQARAAAGRLADRPPGGHAVHGILAWEEAAIVDLFNEWGPVDMSHRILAHRGSYLGTVWVSPWTVDRVLARHGLALKGAPRPGRSRKQPWPQWCEWRPNQLWCWDMSQFERCRAAKYAYAIMDIVSRKWIATVLAAEATSTQVRVLFLDALSAEDPLDDDIIARVAALDETQPTLEDDQIRCY